MHPQQIDPNMSFQNFDIEHQLDQNPNNIISQHLISNNKNNNTPDINISDEKGCHQKSENSNTFDRKGKKVIHRENERQRRQEMSNLFSSLRSILPADYVRGKRSVSDHVAQAVKYIQNLEKNVKELKEKRDELKKCGSSSRYELGGSGSTKSVGSSSAYLPGSVSIYQFKGGLQIEINVSTDQDEGFSLANALKVLFEQGLNVISSHSTNVNGRFIHSLICEVNNVACIDVYRIQQRLVDLVS